MKWSPKAWILILLILLDLGINRSAQAYKVLMHMHTVPSLGLVSRSQTLYLPLPATRGGKGLAHTNRASGSGLHRKTVEEIRPHSMNLIKNGTCRNDFCVRESYTTNLGAYFAHE